MSLSSAKAKLDAQGGDPVTGYISKTDHQESYDELVDDTALTGATTAEAITVSGALVAGTVNGRDPDDLVAGPASATDNALVRFDGTGGKTVQNSGITVNDSGEITTNVTINRTIPTFTVSGSATGSRVYIDAPAATRSDLAFRTGTAARWQFSRSSTAESGSDAGSDLTIDRYSDAGSATTALQITRATGKTTFGSVGATAGLELGASGPRVMSGTGSPEGVVTAPVGSQWTDTAATTGAIRWIKATGTGNTGWVVEYGDTGRRSLAAVLSNSWTASSISLQRSGNIVTLWARSLIGTSASSAVFYTLPVGFRPTADYVPFPIAQSGGTYAVGRGTVDTAGEVTVGGTITDYTAARLLVSFPTADAWPATLPGS